MNPWRSQGPELERNCPVCGGRGAVCETYYNPDIGLRKPVRKRDRVKCRKCGGTGHVSETEKI